MGNHHTIIFTKEIDDFTLYLTGPKTLDALTDDCNVMDLMDLRDGLKTLIQELNDRIDEAARGLDPEY